MKKLTRNETADFLRSHDNFCILTHRRPDGDTIGSAAALCRGLRLAGKTAHVLENGEITEKFAPLVAGLTKSWPEEGDTLVSADVASPTMLPAAFESLLGRIQLRIDHHSSATSFTDWELVDGKSASCAELVWDVLTCLGVEMDQETAEAVYVGTSTDTGCFRYSNVTAHTFETAAACMKAGARVYELNQDLFETNTLARLRMQAWVVDHLHTFQDGKLCVCAIPLAVEQAIGVTPDDMDNISSFPRTVAGVCMAATLRETGDGEVKLSVRAVPGYDATKIAAPLGGGGHKGAAGASLKTSLEEATRIVEEIMVANA